jgi:hypothetical protein
MNSNKRIWHRGHGFSWCPRCLVCVHPEQTYCRVCGYGLDAADINVGHTGYDDHDSSGLLEED